MHPIGAMDGPPSVPEVALGDDRKECDKGRGLRSQRVPETYALRPRTLVRRHHIDKSRSDAIKQGLKAASSRVRPAPLSKYRRRTANARERYRMKEINQAFETLRRILPDVCCHRRSQVSAGVMTKITTLRHAVNYIRSLSRLLQASPPHPYTTDESFLSHSFRPNSFLSSTSSSNTFSPSTSSPGRYSSEPDDDLTELLLSGSYSEFEDDFDAFQDIPSLPEADLTLLLVPEDSLTS